MKIMHFILYITILIFTFKSTYLEGMPVATESTDSTSLTELTETDTKTTSLDNQISTDLDSISNHPNISEKLYILKNILGYTSNQTPSQKSQLNFCNELKKLDTLAKSYKLTKVQINHFLKLFKQAQTSTLMYAGFVKNISDIIQYWEKKSQTVGLSKYQQALQRRKTIGSSKRGRER